MLRICGISMVCEKGNLSDNYSRLFLTERGLSNATHFDITLKKNIYFVIY